MSHVTGTFYHTRPDLKQSMAEEPIIKTFAEESRGVDHLVADAHALSKPAVELLVCRTWSHACVERLVCVQVHLPRSSNSISHALLSGDEIKPEFQAIIRHAIARHRVAKQQQQQQQ